MAHDGPLFEEEHLEPPPRLTIEEIKASIERGLADVKAARTVDGDVFLRELGGQIDRAKAR